MLHAERIVPSHSAERNVLAAICFLFSLRAAYVALIIGTLATAVLFTLSVVLDALLEICHHLAEIWAGSNSIERLLVFVVAWIFFYKCSPLIARVLKHCRRII